MLGTARRYREIAMSLLEYAQETEIGGPRDACIALAVLYQEAAREIEQRHKGWQASGGPPSCRHHAIPRQPWPVRRRGDSAQASMLRLFTAAPLSH
jgi:hypothetical protein